MTLWPATLAQQIVFTHVLVTVVIFLPSVVAAMVRRFRMPPPGPIGAPIRIIALKPLRGLDPNLQQNLESFATLTSPYPLEVFLLLDSESDAATPLARALAARYPERVRVIFGNDKACANPKVGSLMAGLNALGPIPRDGPQQLLWLTDSNVKTSNEHLRAHLDTWFAIARPRKPALVHAPLAAVEGSGLGASFERSHLSTFNNTGAETSLVAGINAVVGKSIFFSRADLEAVGGMRSFGQASGEDFIMGRQFRALGSVRCAPIATKQVLGRQRASEFYRRQLRWSTVRKRVSVVTYSLLEPFGYFGLVLLWGLVGLMPWELVCAVYAVKMACDALLMWAFNGTVRLIDVLLVPLKDLVVLAAWASAFFQTSVSWRGRKLDVTGTDYRVGPPESPRLE